MADRRPTIEDVAARARVGRGSVSRVINGSARVSARTREAVLRAVRELGYVPSEPARTLAGGGAGAVALVLSETPERRFEQPYLGRIMRGIGSAANAAEVRLTPTVTRSATGRTAVADELGAQQVDGVLLISLLRRDPLAALLERGGVPTVLGSRPPGPQPVPYVDADNQGGSRRATEYLIGRGHRRIATIAGPPHSPVGEDRLTGYREALGGRPGLVAFGDFSESGGTLAMRRLLGLAADVDAVFAASDNMALGALRELERQGRRVPADVAVVGVEDAAPVGSAWPELTTVHQPTETMGRRMMELLLARIGGAPAARAEVVCATRLVVRLSA